MTEREALVALQAENARLAALLESHGIAWRTRPAAASPPALTASVQEPAPVAPGTSLSTAEKLALFRRLFRGRTDIYPVRREGKTSGKSGLRQRVAVRCLREAAHQMRRLQPPAAGAAVGFGDLRPPGRKQTVGVYSCSPATSLASHRRWKFGHLAGPPSESSVNAADRSMPWGSTHASNSEPASNVRNRPRPRCAARAVSRQWAKSASGCCART